MPLQPITRENASQLGQIAVLGRGTPYAATYSPNGALIAVASSRGAWLYSATAPENEPRLLEADSFCENLTFSPDGNTLAVCSNDGSVLLWDVKTGARKATLSGFPDILWAIAFSPNGQELAVGGQWSAIWVWDTVSFKLKQILKYHSHSVSRIKYSPDGSLICSRGNDAVWLYDVNTGEAQVILPEGTSASDVAFSPDGDILVIAGRHLWFRNLRNGSQNIIPYKGLEWIEKLSFTPDGKIVAFGCNDGTIRLWDMNSQKERSILHSHTGRLHDVRFSPDGTKLVVVGMDLGDGGYGYDSSVRIWDANTGQECANLTGYTPSVHDITLHPNGNWLALAHADHLIRLWDISEGKFAAIGHIDAKERVWCAAFSPDGKTLATADFEVSLWDVPSYDKRQVFKIRRTGARELGFSFDGQFLAAVAQGRPFVRLWNLKTGEYHKLPEKPRRFRDFWSLAFCPSAPLLALMVSGNQIWIWNLETNTRQTVLKSSFNVLHLAFSPDKKRVVTGGTDDTVNLWDITTGQQTAVFRANTQNRNKGVTSVAFNSDGTLIAFADWDRGVRLLDVETWTEVTSVSGHTWVATKLLFTSDNKLLISASPDSAIRLWGVEAD